MVDITIKEIKHNESSLQYYISPWDTDNFGYKVVNIMRFKKREQPCWRFANYFRRIRKFHKKRKYTCHCVEGKFLRCGTDFISSNSKVPLY